jgi:hypothetical protein
MVVQDAIRRGIEVTVFHRGVSGLKPLAGVRVVLGDRENVADLQRLARLGPWDAVVDVAGSVPAVVGRSAGILADVAARYVFVSTISAYRDWPHHPVDETSPLWDGDPDLDPGTRAWDPDAYGPLKVGCELACRRAFDADRLLILRPHVVLGRYEYVGRLPWWLGRMRRGGQVRAPAPVRAIQPVDVRDLSRFLLDGIGRRGHGDFNVAAPCHAATYGQLLDECRRTVAEDAVEPAELVWVDEDWLVAQGVTQWTELPLWRHAGAPWGMNVDRAQAVGLRTRPLAETVGDTWSWLIGGGQPIAHERTAQHGMDPAREAALIARWHGSCPDRATRSS